MLRYLFIILLLLPFCGRGQVITTVAGNGSSNANGILAINSSIEHPLDIEFDRSGNLYICIGTGDKIRKIDPNGIITTVCGTGSAGYNGDGGLADTSKLNQPAGICLDSAGNIFVADMLNNRVRKIDKSTGIIITVAGTGVNGYNGEGIPALSSQLHNVSDVHMDRYGNLYVAEQQNARIRKIDPSGIITTYVGTGVVGYSGDGGAANLAQMVFPSELKTDVNGNLYFSDYATTTCCVRRVDRLTGIITTVAGTANPNYNGDNIPATSANITPARICFDNYNNLFIGDQINCRIRKIDGNGVIQTVAGDGVFAYGGDGGSALSAQLNRPSGVAFDSCNNLYITEIQVGRIRKVDFNPNCWPVSVNEHKQTSFNFYPNPANTHLTITRDNLQSITITNTLGQIVHSQIATQEKTVVDILALNAGVYFVTVTDKQGGKVTKKVVKE